MSHPSMTQLRDGYTAVVFGASGAIGSAFVAHLQRDPRCQRVIGLSRHSTPRIDLDDESLLENAAAAMAAHGPVHLVLDATGTLMPDGHAPEKRLDDLTPNALARAFALNATGPTLLLKHFGPLLATGERVVWGKLSARVGSIGDNRKGGWYGYRASKAALNMLLQCTAIEWARRRPLAVVAALQPGTVRSRLSAPFVGSQADDPAEAAARLLRVLDALPPQPHAHFVDHRGEVVPW